MALGCTRAPHEAAGNGSQRDQESQQVDGAASTNTHEVSTREAQFAARAEALTNAFQKQLKAALLAVLPAEGPVLALGVCSEIAPQITATASADAKGLHVRRIGTRVRNEQTNVPTEAERRILAELTPETPSKVLQVDGKLTYVRAIYINDPVCLKCHGNVAEMPPALLNELAARYPNDEAVGYSMGELRGAFVVTAQ